MMPEENSDEDADADDFDLDLDIDIDDEPETFERFHDSRVKARTTKKQAKAASTLAQEDENVLLTTTYKPSRHEAVWLYSSLRPFFDEQKLIDDVLFQVKGGKEATVYCCHVAPDAQRALGAERVAAKVYRPRQFRNLRNDAMYRQGRAVLTDEGRAAKATDQRLMRALGKKTEFGMQVQHSSWLLYEYTTLQALFAAGCAVPEPYAVGENAILMGYKGEETRAASTLIELILPKPEAQRVFAQVKESLAILVGLGMVHGDLSAYNILYDGERATIIDLPQVVRFDQNEHAEEIFLRDLTRLCDYFKRAGVVCDPVTLARELRETAP
ncbi:RIO1 family regulatory kinase/ATPase [Armatimonas sp.]|uniref:RIO1 family regulatory kinase/ATPase domain-containing protein n=1 Tax=Armatimonas sp. TaxID=1872638 RepID=UPI003750D5EC